jgi:Ca-activated chloride channel family protein
MKKSQLALIALAAVVIAVIAFLGSGAGSGGDDAATKDADAPGRPPADAVTVAFVYSPEKEPLLKPLLEQFNKAKESVNGRQIVVDASIVASGDAQSMIAGERLKPTVWSPASSLWGRLLNFQADRPLAPDESPSIVRTPLVIAMWEPMAKALGYPKKSLGFGDILKLARSKQGWREYGHREWGDFKLVHTNPDVSTSGLSAVVAEYFAATGKKEGLRESDINGKARRTVRAIERSIVHYGDTTLFISEQLKKSGPGYASAVAMEEATLVAFNRDRGNQPKLVGIYPSEGTFYSDNPFIVLDAPWVTDEQRAAAEVLQRWLGERLTPEVVSRAGFRPADLDTPPVAPIDAANGARGDQKRLARGPQAGERPARVRHVGLDERGEPAPARQGGPERVPGAGRFAGPRRADGVLGPDRAARSDRAVRVPGPVPAADGRELDRRRRHGRLRRGQRGGQRGGDDRQRRLDQRRGVAFRR